MRRGQHRCEGDDQRDGPGPRHPETQRSPDHEGIDSKCGWIVTGIAEFGDAKNDPGRYSEEAYERYRLKNQDPGEPHRTVPLRQTHQQRGPNQDARRVSHPPYQPSPQTIVGGNDTAQRQTDHAC